MNREEFIAAIESMGAVERPHENYRARTWFRVKGLDVILTFDGGMANVSLQEVNAWQDKLTRPYAEALLLIKALISDEDGP